MLFIFLIYIAFLLVLGFKKINWLSCLILFSLPLYLLKIKILGVPANFLEAQIFVLFFVWILKRKIGFLKNIFQIVRENKLLFYSMAILLAGVFISSVFSENFLAGLGILKSWFLAPLMFFTVLISIYESKDNKNWLEDLETLVKFFVYSGFITALISLVYLFSSKLTYDMRLAAFFDSPNQLAMFLSPALICGLGFWFFGKEKKKFFIVSAVIFAALYFTYSFGAFLGVFASFLLFLLVLNKKIKLFGFEFGFNKWFLAFVLMTVFSAALLLSPKITRIFEERSSLSSRLMIWRSAAEIVKNYPIFGIGPGNFQEKYLEFQKYFPPYLEWSSPHPHNIFLAFLLGGGILGLAGFLGVLFWFFKAVKINFNCYLVKISASVAVYTLVHGMFDTTYWRNDLSVIFWFFVGIALIINKTD